MRLEYMRQWESQRIKNKSKAQKKTWVTIKPKQLQQQPMALNPIKTYEDTVNYTSSNYKSSGPFNVVFINCKALHFTEERITNKMIQLENATCMIELYYHLHCFQMDRFAYTAFVCSKIDTYAEGHCITPTEACWRLFGHDIQRLNHIFQRLNIHLAGQCQMRYNGQVQVDLVYIGLQGPMLFCHKLASGELQTSKKYYYYLENVQKL